MGGLWPTCLPGYNTRPECMTKWKKLWLLEWVDWCTFCNQQDSISHIIFCPNSSEVATPLSRLHGQPPGQQHPREHHTAQLGNTRVYRIAYCLVSCILHVIHLVREDWWEAGQAGGLQGHATGKGIQLEADQMEALLPAQSQCSCSVGRNDKFTF